MIGSIARIILRVTGTRTDSRWGSFRFYFYRSVRGRFCQIFTLQTGSRPVLSDSCAGHVNSLVDLAKIHMFRLCCSWWFVVALSDSTFSSSMQWVTIANLTSTYVSFRAYFSSLLHVACDDHLYFTSYQQLSMLSSVRPKIRNVALPNASGAKT